MRKLKELMYYKMHEFEVNGIALTAVITLIVYGGVNLIIDLSHCFNSDRP